MVTSRGVRVSWEMALFLDASEMNGHMPARATLMVAPTDSPIMQTSLLTAPWERALEAGWVVAPLS